MLAGLLLVMFSTMAAVVAAAEPPRRLLLIGNSITYTNNLPALLDALLQGEGRASGSVIEMFVRPGATLEDLARDPRLEGVITGGRYDAVLLQEQGGHTLCAATEVQRRTDSCRQMIEAHLELARRVRAVGASVYYLGTYQPPSASAALVASESWLAARMGARYIGIEPAFLALSARYPQLAWFHEGDRHPGIALSALMAERIALSFYGAYPASAPLCTAAQLYPPGERLDGFVSFADLSAAHGPLKCVLTMAEVRSLTQPVGRLAQPATSR